MKALYLWHNGVRRILERNIIRVTSILFGIMKKKNCPIFEVKVTEKKK